MYLFSGRPSASSASSSASATITSATSRLLGLRFHCNRGQHIIDDLRAGVLQDPICTVQRLCRGSRCKLLTNHTTTIKCTLSGGAHVLNLALAADTTRPPGALGAFALRLPFPPPLLGPISCARAARTGADGKHRSTKPTRAAAGRQKATAQPLARSTIFQHFSL
jgi:hypothetical protein